MERPATLDFSEVSGIVEKGNIFKGAKDGLLSMLAAAKARTATLINFVFDPPYPTQDGKPLEFHWYTGDELVEVNEKLKQSGILDSLMRKIEDK